MKWFLWQCVLMLALSFNSRAQMPYIQFDKTEYDFGKIREKDGIATCRFSFKNEGKSPLIITQVQASCGCTTPSWSKDSVLPGQKGFVEAAYNPEGRPGPFLKTLTIFSNATISSVNLIIKGDVQAEVPTRADQFPRKLGNIRLLSEYLQMGSLSSQGEMTQSFEIYNDSKSAVKPKFDSLPAFVKINFVPSKLKKGQSGKMLVTFSAKNYQQWGHVSIPVYLKTRQKDEARELLFLNALVEDEPRDLPVQEQNKQPIATLSEEKMNLGVWKVDQIATGNLRIKNTGLKPLLLHKFEPSCGCIQVVELKKTIDPESHVDFPVSLKSMGKKGNLEYQITLYTNDPVKPTQTKEIVVRFE